MHKWRRLSLGIRAVLAGALVVGLIALAAPADAQKRGGTLTIVRPTDPVSLDPHTETTAPGAWVYYNILEPLIYLDEKMTIQPRLATSYEVMNPTKVRFKLRPGVKFHDGTPFNAAAVKFTFERAFKSTPPARWASLAGPIAGAEVVDDLTVDIVTKEPYGPILRTMSMLYVSIVSPTAVQKLGDGFLRAPGRDGAVQVRRVEDEHARDHRAEPRLLGREGAARPRDLQGGAGGRGADDRAPDRRRRHGHVPVAGAAPNLPRRTRSTRCTRRRACVSSTSGLNNKLAAARRRPGAPGADPGGGP